MSAAVVEVYVPAAKFNHQGVADLEAELEAEFPQVSFTVDRDRWIEAIEAHLVREDEDAEDDTDIDAIREFIDMEVELHFRRGRRRLP